MKKLLLLVVLVITIIVLYKSFEARSLSDVEVPKESSISTTPSPTIDSKPTVSEIKLPSTKVLSNDYHVFQSFNNCGPASLSMALSYFGIRKSQQELGQELRPYQVSTGINDDKSVTLSELSNKAKELGLMSYHRPNGDIELLKSFIANDLPVITTTRSTEKDDIGHYRVIKGYDETTKEIIQDDSLQGPNLRYSYESFLRLWKTFSYEYVVIFPKEKEGIVRQILGSDIDELSAWEDAAKFAESELLKNPNDVTAGFNLSVAYYHAKEYEKSVEEFEKVEKRLSMRALWYQIEPILSYYELGNYKRVLEITDAVLSNQNAAFSELYIVRGDVYRKQGDVTKARAEFEKAVKYNKYLLSAQRSLDSLE